MVPLLLASTSPYRRELLGRLGLPFEVAAPPFDEEPFKSQGREPRDLAELLASGKARSLSHPNNCVIGGDQLLACEGRIFGKPRNFDKACEQLGFLSGKTHNLITSVSFIFKGDEFIYTDITQLTMRTLSESQIEEYVRSELPLDAAGSYKIENRGISLFASIETHDFTAIQGLPLLWLIRTLSAKGYPV